MNKINTSPNKIYYLLKYFFPLFIIGYVVSKEVIKFDIKAQDIILITGIGIGILGTITNRPYWFIAITIVFWQDFFTFSWFGEQPAGYSVAFGYLMISDIIFIFWIIILIFQILNNKFSYPNGYLRTFFIFYSCFLLFYLLISIILYNAGLKDLFYQIRFWTYPYVLIPMLNFVRNKNELNKLLNLLLIMTIPFVVFSIVIYFLNINISWPYLSGYNTYITYTDGYAFKRNTSPTVTLSFIFSLIFFAQVLHNPWKISKYSLIISLLLINIIITFARGFIIAVIIAHVIIWFLVKRYKNKRSLPATFLSTLLISTIVIILNKYLPETSKTMLRFKEGYSEVVLGTGNFGDRYNKAYVGIKEHPLLGTGFWSGREMGINQPIYFQQLSESFWGQFILRFGVTGLLFFIIFYLSLLRYLFKTLDEVNNSNFYLTLMAIISYLVGEIFWGVSGNGFLESTGISKIILVLLISYKIYELKEEKYDTSI